MRNAETILSLIRERGKQNLPLERVYRLLYNPNLYLLAYGKIYRNDGATTAGVTPETVDGMSQEKINAIIAQLRNERYRWTPVRRVYIDKKNSTKKRPLGIPTWSDKLLQEVVRLLLEAYYEPQFSPHSHGFRPHRGCHTALKEISETWTGTAWFIEGDISACFDSINHQILLSILAKKIHDNRFLRLIGGLLKAGYLEDWNYHATLSGSPQGGVVSPILANIYLDQLDQYVQQHLLPRYNRGSQRRANPIYERLRSKYRYRVTKGHKSEAMHLKKQMQNLPSKDPNDPTYRRLRYVRYADDWLIGFCGPRHEAETIKRKLQEFLKTKLSLQLSVEKTLISTARSQAARFLGYEITTFQDNRKRDSRGYRSINGLIGLKVPNDVLREARKRYMRGGKPIHKQERTHDTVFSIVAKYQQEYRGLVQYYQLAYNLHRFGSLKWVMEQSLTKTIAHKLRITVEKVYLRYATTIETPDGPRRVLQVKVNRENQSPLVTYWGAISLKRNKDAVIDDSPKQVWNFRTELIQRLVADTCELCGSQQAVEVHHVRRLSNLHRQGRDEKPEWVIKMSARRRKTLVVCRECHNDIHAGRTDGCYIHQ